MWVSTLAICALMSLTLPISLSSQPITVNAQQFAATYYVDPSNGNDANSGTLTQPLRTITKAVSLAVPGTLINLLPGQYYETVVIAQSGTLSQPIVIYGPRSAVVRGNQAESPKRIFDIAADYITLQGFTINGFYGNPGEEANPVKYKDQLVYIEKAPSGNPLVGAQGNRVLNLALINAGRECLRLKNFALGNEIAYNTIQSCGVDGENVDNGEGIYIGTTPSQWEGTPRVPDQTRSNHIHHNAIDFRTRSGNECIELKEATSLNIVEYNDCAGQTQLGSGGIELRGDDNIARFNKTEANVGHGFRQGGNNEPEGLFGVQNAVYRNLIQNNGQSETHFDRPLTVQNVFCENVITGVVTATGNFANPFNPACTDPNLPALVGTYGSAGGNNAPTPTPVGSTATATTTPSPTATATATSTSTPTATPTSTPTPQPTATHTPSPIPTSNSIVIQAGNNYFEAEGFTARVGTRWISGVAGSVTYMHIPDNTYGGTTDAERLVYTLTVQAGGNYYVWLRLYGLGGSSDSVNVAMNTGSATSFVPEQLNTWTWKKRSTAYALQAGTNVLKIFNREDGTRVDRIFITNSTTATPTP